VCAYCAMRIAYYAMEYAAPANNQENYVALKIGSEGLDQVTQYSSPHHPTMSR